MSVANKQGSKKRKLEGGETVLEPYSSWPWLPKPLQSIFFDRCVPGWSESGGLKQKAHDYVDGKAKNKSLWVTESEWHLFLQAGRLLLRCDNGARLARWIGDPGPDGLVQRIAGGLKAAYAAGTPAAAPQRSLSAPY